MISPSKIPRESRRDHTWNPERSRSHQSLRQAAIDVDGGASNITGCLRGEEDDETRHFLRPPNATERDLTLTRLQELVQRAAFFDSLIARHLPEPVSQDPSGSDGVHGDPIPAQLIRHGLGQPYHRTPDRVGQYESIDLLLHRGGHHMNDAPATPPPHMRDHLS